MEKAGFATTKNSFRSPVYYASANGNMVSSLGRLFYSMLFDNIMKVGTAGLPAPAGQMPRSRMTGPRMTRFLRL